VVGLSRSFDAKRAKTTLFDALADARQTYGAKKQILEDQERNPLSYTDLIRAAFALGRKIAGFTKPGERVGIMLPASSAAVVTFFALHAFGRVPAMLNFTAGIRNLKAACELAGVKRVLTSHRFVEQGKLHDLIDALETLTTVTYLEDVRKTVGLSDKLFAAAAGTFPKRFRAASKPTDPGVILFTSGSFGAPKGVVLSQQNLVANVQQIAAHIDLDPAWVMFNPLPTFHCFGLTGGALLPILCGIKAFQYPSPLHIKQIPPLIKDTGASVLFATDTFLNQYARSADPGELSGLKFIVCGADGWHDTGDVVSITDDGWVKIKGRVKRFAKVGGEMVSLTAAEDLACAVWPEGRHAVVALPDPKKGERLILVTDRQDAEAGALIAHAQSIQAPEIAVPRKIIRVPEIPVLGTGKTDYVALQRIVDAELLRAA
jgi:acyl-[acyl-carrier-protein]-phospholipid O-acyltransferase/long-chain-fatty-acid--[acyl-carrier-protein] ligase